MKFSMFATALASLMLSACPAPESRPEPSGSGGGGGSGGGCCSEPEPTYYDGERLVVVSDDVVTEDGAKFAHTWLYDMELEAECSWTRAADGKMRCLPGRQFVHGYYADADCKVPGVAVFPCSETDDGPRFVTVPHEFCGGQSVRTSVFAISEEAFPGYRLTYTGCEVIPTDDKAWVVHPLKLEQDPEMFVKVFGL